MDGANHFVGGFDSHALPPRLLILRPRGWKLRRALALLAFPFVLSLSGPAAAQGQRIPARVVSVVDGDTIKVDARPWPRQTIRVNVRVLGMDAPEIFRPKCEAERRKGQAARDYARGIIGREVWLIGVKDDKFGGRVDAGILLADGRDFARAMMDAGHARPYAGGRRESWC